MVRNSNWFTTLIEKRFGKGRPRQEYTDVVKEGRRYVVIKRLSSEKKKLQAYWVEKKKKIKLEDKNEFR